jgi:hypothetical protein
LLENLFVRKRKKDAFPFSCITYSNIKIKQKLVIKFMLIVLLIEKKVLYCLGLIEE